MKFLGWFRNEVERETVKEEERERSEQEGAFAVEAEMDWIEESAAADFHEERGDV